MVVEGVPSDVGAKLTRAVDIPTIGIGAGADCDGQVLVCYDLLGLFRQFKPRFVKRFADVGDNVVEAVQAYVAEVRAGTFPGPEHSFAPRAHDAQPPEATGAAPLPIAIPTYGPAHEDG